MVYTVTVNPCLDYVLRFENLKYGEVNRAKSEELTFGGKGINVSAVLKELKVETLALGFAAGFTGKHLIAIVNEAGIPNNFCILEEGATRINVKVKAETETDLNANGPTINDEDINTLCKKLDSIKEDDYLCLSGSAPEGVYNKILERLNHKQFSLVIDTSKKALIDSLRFKPFLIKPNVDELKETFGREIKTDAEIAQAVAELQTMGAQNVLVSMGGDGAILFTKDGEMIKNKAAKGTLKNSVGAGDSMVAGFVGGYIKTSDYNYALKLGVASGGATAFSNVIATADEIKEVFNSL